VFAVSSLAVRIVLGFSIRALWNGLAWRLALFSCSLMMILGIAPFNTQGFSAAYYLNSVAPFLALFMAWEVSDAWNLSNRRVPNVGSPGAVSFGWWLRRLTVAILTTWSLPIVLDGANDSVLLAKCLALGLSTLLGLVVVYKARNVFRHDGALGSSFRACMLFWASFSAVHLAIFSMPAVFSLVSKIGVQQRTQLAALHWIAENAQPGTDVFIDNYWSEWNRLEIGLHLKSCENRADVQVNRLGQTMETFASASPVVYLLWDDPDAPHRTRPDVEGLHSRRFSGSVWLYQFRLAQPAYLSARLLGRHYGTPPTFPRIVDHVEYAATVYYR